MDHVEALVIGAGPAGAAAALNLAARRRVAMVDRRPGSSERIGESLPGSARRLLTDMHLLESFESQGHLPCFGRRSVWGADEAVEFDTIRDPDGHGWQLDRAVFDAWLRDAAIARGATFVPGTVGGIDRLGERWQVGIATASGHQALTADILIDASGRSGAVAGSLGARRSAQDRLVCGWVHGSAQPAGRGAGVIVVEAERDGWWYTAMMPGRRRVVAFHTDADLPAARAANNGEALLGRARNTSEVGPILVESGFGPIDHFGFVTAHSAALDPCGGHAWLAVGDAALAFDPLSSQGLFNALYTGLAAADAAHGWLAGDPGPLDEYRRTIARVRTAYQHRLADYYALERRWPESPFWQRRFRDST